MSRSIELLSCYDQFDENSQPYDRIALHSCEISSIERYDRKTEHLVLYQLTNYERTFIFTPVENPAPTLEFYADFNYLLAPIFQGRDHVIVAVENFLRDYSLNLQLFTFTGVRKITIVDDPQQIGNIPNEWSNPQYRDHLMTFIALLMHTVREIYVEPKYQDIPLSYPGSVVDTNIYSLCRALWRERQLLVEQRLGRDVTGIVGEYLYTM